MDIETCEIEGLKIIKPKVFRDNRGYFMQSYEKSNFNTEEFGICDFVQDNISMSLKGTIRGLHYQKKYPQAKLVYVISGEIYDVAVDIREGSSTYGQWYGAFLSDSNHKQFYIPGGFAHGFLVVSDIAKVCYKVNNYWDPKDEHGIKWDDPDINISWPGVNWRERRYPQMEDGTLLTISKKDQLWPELSQSS